MRLEPMIMVVPPLRHGMTQEVAERHHKFVEVIRRFQDTWKACDTADRDRPDRTSAEAWSPAFTVPMPGVTLIPTRSRFPVIKGWSYPVAAETVSEALERIPQRAEVELSFYSTKRPSRDHWRERLVEGEFWRPPKDFVRVTGGPEQQWKVTVYAVPSTQQARVRALLVGGGLARLAEWFSEPRPPNWRFGKHRFWVGCQPDLEGLVFKALD